MIMPEDVALFVLTALQYTAKLGASNSVSKENVLNLLECPHDDVKLKVVLECSYDRSKTLCRLKACRSTRPLLVHSRMLISLDLLTGSR